MNISRHSRLILDKLVAKRTPEPGSDLTQGSLPSVCYDVGVYMTENFPQECIQYFNGTAQVKGTCAYRLTKPTHMREPQFALPGVDVAAAIREPVTKLEDTAWRLRNASDTQLVTEATLTKAEKKRLTARIRADVVADRHDKLRERAAAPRRGRAPNPYADLDAPFPTVEPV